MGQWREQMRPFYYDASEFDTYLEQLGIEYPTIRSRPVSQDEDGALQPDSPALTRPGGS